MIKKICLYTVIEILNFVYKYFSFSAHQDEYVMYCMLSTVFCVLFQTSIFQNSLHTGIIVFKHIYIWYFFDNISKSLSFYPILEVTLSPTIIFIWTLYEKEKRARLRHYYYLKTKKEKYALQISDLLRLFRDGLIILNPKFNIQYTNDKANKLIMNGPDKFIDRLKIMKFQDEKSIFESLCSIKFESKEMSISLGITELNHLLYEWTVNHITWNDGLSYMIIIKDVTTILKIERITSENNAKSALIRSVSHELRTPVHAITLLADSLIQDVNESCKGRILNIKTCAELLTFQISDILDYSELLSKKFKLNKSFCNFRARLEECINPILFQVKFKGLEFKKNIDSSIINYCYIDYYRIQKIIINLLTNAVKYTYKGSIELSVVNIETGIKISIKDTGIGIPKEQLSKIFDMFSDKISGMSGLGLHISNRVLKYLGSALSVTSEENQGSIFSFCLSIDNTPCDDSKPRKGCSCEISDIYMMSMQISNNFDQNYPKVLIVDDNDFNRLLLGNMLTNNGISYIEANNGKMAVEATMNFDKKNTPVFCIIMDCNMPVMDGWEATKTINEKYKTGIIKFLPIIIGHTAYSSSDDIQRCYDSGMVSYILKPTTQEQILIALRKYIYY